MVVQNKKKLGLFSVIFLGIGSMVGAGIFALLGEAGAIAGKDVYFSFILGGIIALLSGYSFAKLSQRYPSRGGLIEYLTQCYGEGFFSSVTSILFYLSSMTAIAMVAKTFGIYTTALLGLANTAMNHNIISLGLLISLVIINLLGARTTAIFENSIVSFKLLVLFFFAVISLFFIKPGHFNFQLTSGMTNVFYSIGLTFFAYEGFRVITNTVEDLKDSQKNIMKAMIYSILIVMALYIIISIGVFGNFTLAQVQKYKEYVLAKIAEHLLGVAGFLLISITALISTASSVNANLYAISNVSYTMAKKGELPKEYMRMVYKNFEGLIITSVLLALMLIFFDLTQIAVIGSISILFIHFLVHVGHLLKIKETKANPVLISFAIIAILSTIILILEYTHKNMPMIGWYLFYGVLLAFAIEITLRISKIRFHIKRQIHY